MSVTEDELLEQIAAAPEDLAPRAVYLDWLADHGDPRASSGGGRSRGPFPELPGVRRGLAGRPSWLGALSSVAAPRDCRFVDGVLETLVLHDHPEQPQATLVDPRLATVRELKLVPGSAGRAAWGSGRMASLQRLTGPANALMRLGHGGPPGRLGRLHLLASLDVALGSEPAFDLPHAQQLLLGYSPNSGAQVPHRVRLDPSLVAHLEPHLDQLAPRRKHAEVGIEVDDATIEGIARWIGLSAERGAVHFVVHAASVISLDAEGRTLRIGPYAGGRAVEKRLLLVSTLLRELDKIPLREVEVLGPRPVDKGRKAKNLLVDECRRRGDVTALRVGGVVLVP